MKFSRFLKKTLAATLVLTFSSTSTILYSGTSLPISDSAHQSLTRQIAAMNDTDVLGELARLTGRSMPQAKDSVPSMPGFAAAVRSELRENLRLPDGTVPSKEKTDRVITALHKVGASTWMELKRLSDGPELTTDELALLAPQVESLGIVKIERGTKQIETVEMVPSKKKDEKPVPTTVKKPVEYVSAIKFVDEETRRIVSAAIQNADDLMTIEVVDLSVVKSETKTEDKAIKFQIKDPAKLDQLGSKKLTDVRAIAVDSWVKADASNRKAEQLEGKILVFSGKVYGIVFRIEVTPENLTSNPTLFEFLKEKIQALAKKRSVLLPSSAALSSLVQNSLEIELQTSATRSELRVASRPEWIYDSSLDRAELELIAELVESVFTTDELGSLETIGYSGFESLFSEKLKLVVAGLREGRMSPAYEALKAIVVKHPVPRAPSDDPALEPEQRTVASVIWFLESKAQNLSNAQGDLSILYEFLKSQRQFRSELRGVALLAQQSIATNVQEDFGALFIIAGGGLAFAFWLVYLTIVSFQDWRDSRAEARMKKVEFKIVGSTFPFGWRVQYLIRDGFWRLGQKIEFRIRKIARAFSRFRQSTKERRQLKRIHLKWFAHQLSSDEWEYLRPLGIDQSDVPEAARPFVRQVIQASRSKTAKDISERFHLLREEVQTEFRARVHPVENTYRTEILNGPAFSYQISVRESIAIGNFITSVFIRRAAAQTVSSDFPVAVTVVGARSELRSAVSVSGFFGIAQWLLSWFRMPGPKKKKERIQDVRARITRLYQDYNRAWDSLYFYQSQGDEGAAPHLGKLLDVYQRFFYVYRHLVDNRESFDVSRLIDEFALRKMVDEALLYVDGKRTTDARSELRQITASQLSERLLSLIEEGQTRKIFQGPRLKFYYVDHEGVRAEVGSVVVTHGDIGSVDRVISEVIRNIKTLLGARFETALVKTDAPASEAITIREVKNGGRSELRNFSAEQLSLLDRAVTTYGLGPADRMYILGMWGQYLFPDPSKTPLKIGSDRSKGENFILASELSEADRTRLLGATPYAQLDRVDNLSAAKQVVITVNSMDGGIGESLGRTEWKARQTNQPASEIALGAKGTDLGYNLTFPSGETFFVSIAEAKVQDLKFYAKLGAFGGIQFQPLANAQSVGSYEALFKSARFEDRVKGIPGLSIREDLENSGIKVLPTLLQADLPRIHVESGNLTLDKSIKRQPGGHGQWGVTFMVDTYQNAPPQDGNTHIRVFYNGDNLNSAPDPYIAGYMARNRIPIMKLTTAAMPIDKKGGKDGVRIVDQVDKTLYVPDQMEIADAKNSGQENLFVMAGQEGGIGETGKQPFNTNVIYFNTSILHPLLRDLAEIVGGELALAALISPTLINQKSKIVEIDGQHYLPIDGAIGTVVHNLNSYLMLHHAEPAIAALLKKHELSETGQVLYFVDVPRTQHFTPVKNAVDMWLQRMSDYYWFNPETMRLKDSEKGLVPPEIVFEDKSYTELANVEDALGRAKVRRLKSLIVKGKVHLKDATLIGEVEIHNKTGKLIDLNDPKFSTQLASVVRGGKLHLENVTVTIEDENTIHITSNRSELRSEVVDSFKEAAALVEAAQAKGWISSSALQNILSWGDDAHKIAHADLTAQFKSAGNDEKVWKNINDDWYTILKAGTAGIRGKRGWGTNRINLFTLGLFHLAHANMVASDSYDNLVREFDPEFNAALAVSIFPHHPVKKAVALGYDSRHGSYDPKTKQPGAFVKLEALINAAKGVRAFVFREPTSTPQLSFTVHAIDVGKDYKIVSGSMSTASHNPSSDNGNKPYKPDGSQSTGRFADDINRHLSLISAADLANLTYDGINILENIDQAFDHAVANGDVKWIGGPDDIYNADEQFIKAELEEAIHTVGEQFDPKYINLQSARIVVSPLYGVSKRTLKELFRRRGLREDQIIWVEDEPNPDFPNVKLGKPNPETPEAREVALQKALEVDADLVLWTDPDADRPAVAAKINKTRKAQSVTDYASFNGNQQLAILTAYLIDELVKIRDRRADRTTPTAENAALAKQAEKIVEELGSILVASTVVSGDFMKVIARANGARVVETLTGFKYIGDQVERRSKAIQQAAQISEAQWIKLSKEEKIRLALEHSELFLFGGEESLGSLSSDGPHDKDAISGVMWFVEILGRLADKPSLSLPAYLNDLYKEFGYFAELFPMLQKGKKYAGVELSEEDAMKVIKAEEGSSILNTFRNKPPREIGGKQVIAVLDFQAQTAKSPDGMLLFDVESHSGLITPDTEGIPTLFRKQLAAIRVPAQINSLPFVKGIYSFAHTAFKGSKNRKPEALPKENFIMLLLEDGSKVIARPSGTEPVIKFYMNGRGLYSKRQEVDAWLKKASVDLEKIADDVARERFPEKFTGRSELRQAPTELATDLSLPPARAELRNDVDDQAILKATIDRLQTEFPDAYVEMLALAKGEKKGVHPPTIAALKVLGIANQDGKISRDMLAAVKKIILERSATVQSVSAETVQTNEAQGEVAFEAKSTVMTAAELDQLSNGNPAKLKVNTVLFAALKRMVEEAKVPEILVQDVANGRLQLEVIFTFKTPQGTKVVQPDTKVASPKKAGKEVIWLNKEFFYFVNPIYAHVGFGSIDSAKPLSTYIESIEFKLSEPARSELRQAPTELATDLSLPPARAELRSNFDLKVSEEIQPDRTVKAKVQIGEETITGYADEVISALAGKGVDARLEKGPGSLVKVVIRIEKGPTLIARTSREPVSQAARTKIEEQDPSAVSQELEAVWANEKPIEQDWWREDQSRSEESKAVFQVQVTGVAEKKVRESSPSDVIRTEPVGLIVSYKGVRGFVPFREIPITLLSGFDEEARTVIERPYSRSRRAANRDLNHLVGQQFSATLIDLKYGKGRSADKEPVFSIEQGEKIHSGKELEVIRKEGRVIQVKVIGLQKFGYDDSVNGIIVRWGSVTGMIDINAIPEPLRSQIHFLTGVTLNAKVTHVSPSRISVYAEFTINFKNSGNEKAFESGPYGLLKRASEKNEAVKVVVSSVTRNYNGWNVIFAGSVRGFISNRSLGYGRKDLVPGEEVDAYVSRIDADSGFVQFDLLKPNSGRRDDRVVFTSKPASDPAFERLKAKKKGRPLRGGLDDTYNYGRSELRSSKLQVSSGVLETSVSSRQAASELLLNAANTRVGHLFERGADLDVAKNTLVPALVNVEGKIGLAVSRALAFDEGILPVFAALAKQIGVRVVVIAPTRLDGRLVEATNQEFALSVENELLIASDYNDAVRLLRKSGISHAAYLTSNEGERALVSRIFNEVTVLSKSAIQRMKLSVAGLAEALNEARLVYEQIVQSA